MQNKLFSVIIATYNAAKTLDRCLSSVVHQKEDMVEIVVIDGASSDGTIDIVNRYSTYIDYFISEPDQGVYDAWNKALPHCHGDWIMFLGADDYYVDGIFQKYASFVSSHNIDEIDIISAKCQLISSDGTPLRVFGAEYNWDEFRNKNRLSHGSALHNRKLFDEVGRFDTRFKISADYELLLRKQLKSLFLDEVLIYMQNGGMSYSANGLWQTFEVKRYRQSSNIFFDVYYLLKGLIGFYLRKILWSVIK